MRRANRLPVLSVLIIMLIVSGAVVSADTGGLTVSNVGAISNQWITEYNPGDGYLWTMTTAGFDAIGKLSVSGTFTVVDGFVGGGGGASTETMQLLHGIGSKGTLFVYDCNWGGRWWRYDAATHAKTAIGLSWVSPSPNPGCGAQFFGMATNREGTLLYWHVGDKIWALDPVAGTAAVVLTDSRLAASNAVYKLAYDDATDTLLGIGSLGGVPTLYRMDVNTGIAAVLSVPGLNSFYGLVSDPDTGLIYTTPAPNPDGVLYEIDPTTGAYNTFQLGAGTFNYVGAFAPARSGAGNSLYAMLNGSPNRVVEIVGNFPISAPTPSDTTPPIIAATVTPSANAEGWHSSAVTVSWSVSDPESSVDATSGCDPAVLNTDTAGVTLICEATNGAGLTAAESVTIRLDQTPPTVTYSGNAGAYTVDQAVAITCLAADVLSGLAADTCADVTGPAYSFPLGINTFSATATDRAGNTITGSVSFEVTVTFDSLANLTDRFAIRPGIARSLEAKLRAAKAAAARGKMSAAIGALDAFMHEVSAQSGKAISEENAALLTTWAQHLQAQISAGT